MAQLAAGLGSALACRGPEQAAEYFGKQRAQAKADIEGQSQSTRDIVNQYLKKKYYDQAAQDQNLDRQMKMTQMNMSSQDRRDAMREKLDFQRERNEEKKALKDQDLQTPFGLANTKDDAKQLKEGYESKTNFDSKIQELIDLRKKYGGEVFNREAVARGKQLSKDLLLTYKNMAKLGVLSQADENIINAIIPNDPLAYNSPLAAVQGQDPILNNLKKFKGDSDNDFQTRIKTRVREGSEIAPQIEENKIANDDEKALARQKRIQELKSLARK
jgi:hypothetical protein